MTDESVEDLVAYCGRVARQARDTAIELGSLHADKKNQWLNASATELRAQSDTVLKANARDVARAAEYGLTDAQVDRLRLSAERIDSIARGLEEIAMLPDPIGEIIESTVRPNGLDVSRVRVPLGVVFFIYESRPNVTADAAAICLKSGNAVILRGGKEARNSSSAIIQILQATGTSVGIPENAVQLVSTTDRKAVDHFLKLDQLIDVAIPRGGEGLITRVAREARMPVIKHYHGNCHVYIDQSADLEMATEVVVNSKCQRMGVCNACESLVLHSAVAASVLPKLVSRLQDHQIEVRGDERTCVLVPAAKPATSEDYATEYLGPILSVKIVDSLGEAIQHINTYGSRHTDAIITRDLASARRFANAVDSSAVMINASTRFNDGGQFGLGAEIGISTDKFHARGPCGLRELTSYKYVVYGNGHVRN